MAKIKMTTFDEFCKSMRGKRVDPRYLITPQQFLAMPEAERAQWLAEAPANSPVRMALKLVADAARDEIKQPAPIVEEN